jgi:hypothetical protein
MGCRNKFVVRTWISSSCGRIPSCAGRVLSLIDAWRPDVQRLCGLNTYLSVKSPKLNTSIRKAQPPYSWLLRHHRIQYDERVIFVGSSAGHTPRPLHWQVSKTDDNPSINIFKAYLALSSCLGDSLRRQRNMSPRPASMTSFGKQYAMNLNSGAGQGGWEQIEMENMLEPEGDTLLRAVR